jgi:hypothetical protein
VRRHAGATPVRRRGLVGLWLTLLQRLGDPLAGRPERREEPQRPIGARRLGEALGEADAVRIDDVGDRTASFIARPLAQHFGYGVDLLLRKA